MTRRYGLLSTTAHNIKLWGGVDWTRVQRFSLEAKHQQST